MNYMILRKFSLILSASVFAFGISAARAQTTTLPTIDGVQIRQAEFGLFTHLDQPGTTLEPSRTVARDGRPIGWVIALDTQKQKVRWREEFTVPAPPQHWGLKPDTTDVYPATISADRLTASTERLVPVGAGTISHWWRLDATDPAGPHTMRVYIEDVLVGNFAFDVK